MGLQEMQQVIDYLSTENKIWRNSLVCSADIVSSARLMPACFRSWLRWMKLFDRLRHRKKDSNKSSLACSLALSLSVWHIDQTWMTPFHSGPVVLPVCLSHLAKLLFDLRLKQKWRRRLSCVGIKLSMTSHVCLPCRNWDLHYIKQIAPDLWPVNGPAQLSSICSSQLDSAFTVWFLHLGGLLDNLQTAWPSPCSP